MLLNGSVKNVGFVQRTQTALEVALGLISITSENSSTSCLHYAYVTILSKKKSADIT